MNQIDMHISDLGFHDTNGKQYYPHTVTSALPEDLFDFPGST